MDCKRQPATTMTNRTGSSERGRNLAGGRRATKKDMANDEISDRKKGHVENKGKEESNVLRTRSGRTRTTTNPSNATTSRKKATTLTPVKPSSVEIAIKITDDVSSEVAQSKEEAEGTISTDVKTEKVCLYSSNYIYIYIYIYIIHYI